MSIKSFVGRIFNLHAPAKLNLRLKIEGRDEDGYHLLSMLNMTTSLFDEISLEIQDSGLGIEIEEKFDLCSHHDVLPADISIPDLNLATKAAKLFFERFSISLGVHIILRKNIPIGAGLGGGSSDGASVLKVLADFFSPYVMSNMNITTGQYEDEIHKLSLKLGADVPYLLNGGFSWVSGIGDKLKPLDGRFLEGLECLIIVPNSRVMTKRVFDLYREEFPTVLPRKDHKVFDLIKRFPSFESKMERRSNLFSLIENDLEEIVIREYPDVGKALFVSRSLPGVASGMTGSGASVFVIPSATDNLPTTIEGELSNELHPSKFKLLRAFLASTKAVKNDN